jgi:hypothetical protein
MRSDFTILLWLLKLGALINLYFLVSTLLVPVDSANPHIIIPALILFAVSGYRCLFPNRYKDNVVLHDTVLSSTLITRVLATFVEVSWIYQFSYVLRLLNVEGIEWINLLSWLMVIQVVVSQGFVWSAILTGRLSLYFYEELGWALIFIANTASSAFLYITVDASADHELLLSLNLLFGGVYLPWQLFHLRSLWTDAQTVDPNEPPALPTMADRLRNALYHRRPSTDATSWGGVIGVTWMTAYWASLIPLWVHQIVVTTAR